MSTSQSVVQSLCGFLLPAATLIGLAVLPGSDRGSVVTSAEIITAIVASIITAGAAVYPTDGASPAAAAAKPAAVDGEA